MNYSLYIDGKFLETSSKQNVINPATLEPIAQVSIAGAKEVELAIDAARRAYDCGPWKELSLEERKKYISKISEGILEKAGELAQLESDNSGKPLKESTFMDIPSSAQTFEYFANNLERFLAPEALTIQSQLGCVQASLTREPRGVTVLIVPWNYPLLIASWKMAQSLAAGNTVILKPSSVTPLTALELAKIADNAGLPPGVVNVITASGDAVGELLCSDKRVDMISFTGSNAVGKKILEYTSSCVKKATMELGGKSAGIVLPDADLELAVNGLLCSIFLNQGQMCTAMSRIFVHAEIFDAFVDDFVQKTKRIKLGTSADFEAQMGPLISESHRQKVIGFVEMAKKEGAKLLCGGKVPGDPALKNGFFFEPAVFIDVTPEMSIFQEEVFGPVVCIARFSSIDEAIALANNSSFGLAASVWTKNSQTARDITQRLDAGTVWINTYGMFFNELPYGGFKQSGFGKELGKEGFLEYTRLKNALIDTTTESKPLVNYWYGF